MITDGIDTSSGLTPGEVSGIASAIDVPVYIIATVLPIDHPGREARSQKLRNGPERRHRRRPRDLDRRRVLREHTCRYQQRRPAAAR